MAMETCFCLTRISIGMPVVDVAGEGREIVGFSIEKVIAELCAYAAGATGQGEGAKHKMLLAVDLGHDPGARGVADLRHSYPCFEPEVVASASMVVGKKFIG